MRAMPLTGLHTMRMTTRPDPVLAGPDEVLLRVESVGVCGSDIHYYTEGRIGSQVVSFPFLVGHECSATVLEAGPAVTRVREGDRVAVEPAISCGACDQCRAGRRHTCRTLRFLGCPGQAEGCLCDYLVMPEACCHPVAQGTSFDAAALCEPLSIGCHAVRLAGLSPGARIGILGAGPIGLCVLLAARAAGVAASYVTEPIAARRAVAGRLGASWTGDPHAAPPAAAGIEALEPLLLDVVFECSGEQEALDDAVNLLQPGGRLMLIGIPTADRVSFAIDPLRRKELRLQNVRRQNECMRPAIDLIERSGLDVSPLRTHTFTLDEAAEAFDLVAGYADGVVKAMIHVQG